MKNSFLRALAVCVLLLAAQAAFAQTISVSGQILDASDGQPLIGAGVIPSTGGGTITDHEGKYVINVAKDATLTFSSLGYVSVTEAVDGRTVINLSLDPDNQSLEEVVVLGYTTQKKAELSSSVVTMSSDKLLDVSTPDVGNMLQGKVAGVVVMNTSGQPGASADIRIRGTGSITAGAGPLYVVDGVAGGAFNPNDIETITVLKDASATALYGAAASGGVIVVTTKNGQQDKTTVNFKASAGIKRALMGRFHPMDSEELVYYNRSMFSKALGKTKYPDSLFDQDFNWMKACFKTGIVQDYYASVAGSIGKVKYYVSLDHFNEKGTLINTNFQKTAARVNLSAPLAKRLTMNVRLNYAYAKDRGASSWRLLDYAYYAMPWDIPYVMDQAGNRTDEVIYITSKKEPRSDTGGKWYTQNPSNILHSEQYNYAKSHSDSFTADLQLIWNVTDWLTLSTFNRYDMSHSYYEEYTDPRTYDGAGTGSLLNNDGEWQGWGTTNIAKFFKTFGGAHDFSATIGWEFGESYARTLAASGTNFPAGQRSLSNAVMSGIEGVDYRTRSWAVLGQAQYSYLGKYVVTASIRYDQSSLFGPKNRGGFFPGASAAWIISREKFMQGQNVQNVLSFLKLRAGYGKTGNNNIAPFQYQDTFSLSSQYNGNKTAFLQRLANPNLGWEAAYMASVGIDATFAKLVDVTIDLYHTTNKDILLEAPMPPSSGFFSMFDNVGTVRNMGIELAVDATLLQRKDFRWTGGFNIGLNQNRVLKLPEHEDMVINRGDVTQILREGQDVYSWYMPKWAGVNAETGEPQWERIEEDGTVTLVNKYNKATSQIVGSASPWFSGGLNTAFSWKGLTLSLAGNFVVGNKIYNKTRENMDADGGYTGLNQMSLENGLGWVRWERNDPDTWDIATHPEAVAGRSDGSYKMSSRYLEDGSFFRLRNVTLSYDLPQNAIEKMRMSGFRIFVSADNVLTFSRFSGTDPEVRLDSDTYNHAGMFASNYPVPLSVVLGIDIKF